MLLCKICKASIFLFFNFFGHLLAFVSGTHWEIRIFPLLLHIFSQWYLPPLEVFVFFFGPVISFVLEDPPPPRPHRNIIISHNRTKIHYGMTKNHQVSPAPLRTMIGSGYKCRFNDFINKRLLAQSTLTSWFHDYILKAWDLGPLNIMVWYIIQSLISYPQTSWHDVIFSFSLLVDLFKFIYLSL